MENIIDSLYSQNSERTYQLASKNKRFANYIIDVIGYYIFAIVIGIIWVALNPEDYTSEVYLDEDSSNVLLEYLFGFLIITLYYTLLEYFLQGKTIGKLITKTRAVTEDNRNLDFETALKRSLCRLIPFEAFSFLGDNAVGWHDSLSKTKVIEDIDWQAESDFV